MDFDFGNLDDRLSDEEKGNFTEPFNKIVNLLAEDWFKGYQSMRLLDEFTEGKSDTRVFLAEVKKQVGGGHGLQIVLKLGKASDMRREVTNYLEIEPFIKHSILFSKIIKPGDTLKQMASGQLLTAIAYSFTEEQVPGKKSISLCDFARNFIRGDIPWNKMKTVLEVVFSSFKVFDLEKNTGTGKKLQDYYLDRWEPNYQVEVSRYRFNRNDKKHVLTKGFDPDKLSKNIASPNKLIDLSESPENKRNAFAMAGLRLVWQNESYFFLDARPTYPFTMKINGMELLEKERNKIAKSQIKYFDIWAKPTRVRYDAYKEALKMTFPGETFEVKAFDLDELKVHNPLCKRLSSFFKKLPEVVNMSPVHGDLHPGNIWVVMDDQWPPELNVPMMIDYGLAGLDVPKGVDHVRLLGGLIRDAVAAEIEFSQLKRVLGTLFGLMENIGPVDEPAKRAFALLQFLLDKTKEVVNETTVWHHLYGFAWIGLKWPADEEKAGVNGQRACFLIACMAANRIAGPPDRDESSRMLTTGGAGETATQKSAVLTGTLKDHPVNELLDEWMDEVEKDDWKLWDKAALHGKKYRQSMVKLLDILVKHGLQVKEEDAPLLLAAVHLNSVGLWTDKEADQRLHNFGPLSTAFVVKNLDRLKQCGVPEDHHIDLQNILAAFPAFPAPNANDRTRTVGALICLAAAVHWGRDRVPFEVLEKRGTGDKWLWARLLASEPVKQGKTILVKNREGILSMEMRPHVKAADDVEGNQLAQELTEWARYLLKDTQLPELLERYWNLRGRVGDVRVDQKSNIRYGGLNVSRLMGDRLGSSWKSRRTPIQKKYPVPGCLEAKPLEQSRTPVTYTLEQLTLERVTVNSVDNGHRFLSGGVPQWGDIHDGWDAPRGDAKKKLDEIAARLEKGGKPSVLWVHSAAGNGKTTVLMRMAYQLVKEKKAAVWWRPPNVSPDERLDAKELESFEGPTVVVLDDAQLVPNIPWAVKRCRNRRNGPPVHFILGYQGVQWGLFRPKSRVEVNVDHIEYNLDFLSDNETSAIANRLQKAGLVDPSRSESDVAHGLKNDGTPFRSDLLTAMLITVKAKGENDFTAIIHDLIESIQDRHILEAYAAVSAVSRLHGNTFLSGDFLEFHMGMEKDEFKRKVLEPLYAEMRQLMTGRDYRRLRSRHPLIADIAYRYLLSRGGFQARSLYAGLVENSITAGRFSGWTHQFKVCTTILEKIKCRDLRWMCYGQLVKTDAPDAPLWHSFASMAASEGNIELARILYYRSIRLDNENPKTWQAWGMLEERAGALDKARDLFANGVKADRGHAPLWQAWGLLEERAGALDKARDLFAKGANANPRDAATWQAWGLLEERAGALDKARDLFAKGVKADRGHAPLWQAWGLLEERAGDFKKAQEYMEKSAPFIKGSEAGLELYNFFKDRQQRRSKGETVAAHPVYEPKLSPIEPIKPTRPLTASSQTQTDPHPRQTLQEDLNTLSQLTNDQLLDRIRHLLEEAEKQPPPLPMQCHPDEPCVKGTCPFR